MSDYKIADTIPAITLFFVTVLFLSGGISVFEFPKANVVIFSALVALSIFFARTFLVKGSEPELTIKPSSNMLFKQSVFFLSIMALSALYSFEPTNSLMGSDRAQTTVLYFAMVFILLLLTIGRSTEFRETKFFKATLVSVCVVNIYSVIQAIGIDPVAWSQANFSLLRSFSTLGNPLSLASFHVLTIPLCLSATLRMKGQTWRFVALLSLAFSFVSHLHTFSRAGWLATVVSLIILIVVTFYFMRDRVRSILITIVLSIVLAFLLNAGIENISKDKQSTGTKVVERIFIGAGGLDASSLSRILVWKSTLKMIADQPLIGYGPLTFTDIWPEYRDAEQFKVDQQIRYYDNPHNYYLEMAVSGGVFLLLGLLWLILSAFLRSFTSIRRSGVDKIDGVSQDLLIALVSSTIGFCVAIFFSFVTAATAFIFIYFLFLMSFNIKKELGLGGSDQQVEKQVSEPPGRSNINLALVAIVILVLISAIFMRLPMSEFYYVKGQGALDRQDIPSDLEIQALERSIQLIPWRTDHRIGLATAIFSASEVEDEANVRIELQNRAIDILGKIIDAEPSQRLAYYPLLNHAITTGNLIWAVEINNALLKYDPMDPIAIYYRGEISLLKGDEKKALMDYARSYELQSLDLRPLRKMTSIYLKNGNKREALRALNIIISIDSNDRTAKDLKDKLLGS